MHVLSCMNTDGNSDPQTNLAKEKIVKSFEEKLQFHRWNVSLEHKVY